MSCKVSRLTAAESMIVLIVVVPIIFFLCYQAWIWERESLEESAAYVTFAKADELDPSTLIPGLDGRLVHAMGRLGSEKLRDSVTGMEVDGVFLRRDVEYFQWKEVTKRMKRKVHDHRLNKDVDEVYDTYDYQMAWTSRPVNVETFHDHWARAEKENHEVVFCKAAMLTPTPVRLGAYALEKGFTRHLEKAAEPLTVSVSPVWLQAVDAKIRDTLTARSAKEPVLTRHLTSGMLVHTFDNIVYFGKDPNSPQIGDVRLVYSWIPPEKEFSLIARVHGGVLEDVTTPDGRSLGCLSSGKRSAEELLGVKNTSLDLGTWLLRGLIWFGIALFLIILWVPFHALAPAALPVRSGLLAFSLLGSTSLSLFACAAARLPEHFGTAGVLSGIALLCLVIILLKGWKARQ